MKPSSRIACLMIGSALVLAVKALKIPELHNQAFGLLLMIGLTIFAKAIELIISGEWKE